LQQQPTIDDSNAVAAATNERRVKSGVEAALPSSTSHK